MKNKTIKKVATITAKLVWCVCMASCVNRPTNHSGCWQGMHNLELVTLKLHDTGRAEFQNTSQILLGTWSQYDSKKSYINIHGRGELTTSDAQRGLLKYNKAEIKVHRVALTLPQVEAPKPVAKPAVKPKVVEEPKTQSRYYNKLP